ncbi:glycosyltransferase [Kitasatospora phosalacinea]|uniref:glycosyltransferase n=1 Tax=Kitasatospora phosalacinea TaxID=2065 RepID=UPI0036630BD3
MVTRGSLVLHDWWGHPFQAGLSRELAGRGRVVRHLYRAVGETPRGALAVGPGDPPSLSFGAVADGGRGLRGAWRYAAAVGRELPGRGAVLLSGNAPPLVQAALLLRARWSGAVFVHWLQDVRSAQGRGPGRRWCRAVEAWTARHSDRVVAVCPQFARWARRVARVAAGRVAVVPNWGDLAVRAAGPDRPDGEVLLYTGTLDGRHAPGLLLALAEACERAGRGRVVVATRGAGRVLLERARHELGLSRLELRDWVGYGELPAVLGGASVLLVTLAGRGAAQSVPSKLPAFLCAGRCVLLAAPAGSASAELGRGSGGAVVVGPDDPDGFAAAALALLADPDRRARLAAAGREFAEREFAPGRIADRFLPLLAAPAGGGPSRKERHR